MKKIYDLVERIMIDYPITRDNDKRPKEDEFKEYLRGN